MEQQSLLFEGDHLDRTEFHSRYCQLPDLKKAELIEGRVHIRGRVRYSVGNARSTITGVFGLYRIHTPQVAAGCNCSVELDDLNELQPDVVTFIPRKCGGGMLTRDGYLARGPEFVADVSDNPIKEDVSLKVGVYARHHVKEYLVWRTEDAAIDWFVHDGSQFQRTEPDADGVIRSRIFPGLWIDTLALLGDDGSRLLATLDRGLASPEHAAFVARLREAADRIRAR